MAVAQVSLVSAVKAAPAAKAARNTRRTTAVKVVANKAGVARAEVARKAAPVALSVGELSRALTRETNAPNRPIDFVYGRKPALFGE